MDYTGPYTQDQDKLAMDRLTGDLEAFNTHLGRDPDIILAEHDDADRVLDAVLRWIENHLDRHEGRLSTVWTLKSGADRLLIDVRDLPDFIPFHADLMVWIDDTADDVPVRVVLLHLDLERGVALYSVEVR